MFVTCDACFSELLTTLSTQKRIRLVGVVGVGYGGGGGVGGGCGVGGGGGEDVCVPS